MNLGWLSRRVAALIVIIVYLGSSGDVFMASGQYDSAEIGPSAADVTQNESTAAVDLQKIITAANQTEFVPQQLLVQFRDGVADSAVQDILRRTGSAIVKEYRNTTGLKLLSLPDGLTVRRARVVFSGFAEVEIAEPNLVYLTSLEPDDPDYDRQWGLKNIGQTGGIPGVDINAAEAWNVTTGGSDVYIGVMDTGVDYSHPDLVSNLWINPNEIPGNDVDDDDNGWVDDINGTNAAREDTNPAWSDSDVMDRNDHGTHVTGTIAASGNNGIGLTGVMWQATIVTCKAFDGSGSGRLSAIIECLEYFAVLKDSGVDIVATNNSWGGGGYSQILYNAISEHLQRDMLFISAAGNDGADVDAEDHYPATYDLDNILSVAAIDATGSLASFSNYGATKVDIAAPGVDIYSTTRGGRYEPFNGTSMAAPHVTGVVGLLSAKHPQLSAAELKTHILSTGVDDPGLQGLVASGKRLSAVIPILDIDGDGMDDDWEDLHGLDPADPADAFQDPDSDGLNNLNEYLAASDPFLADTDNDGLSDADEVNNYLTNPNDADSDGDTVPDFDEVNSYGTDPTAADSDNDGLDDGDELNNTGTNPLVVDSDGDGIADGWEDQFQLDPFDAADAANDDDGDGLTNLEEFQQNTNPGDADTDGDGLEDNDELLVFGTNPTVADTDGDEMPDGWEAGFGLDPLDPNDAAMDSDDDTWSNNSEYRVGTDPTVASSIPDLQPWHALQGGPSHTGHVKVETDANDFSVRWLNEHATYIFGEQIAMSDTQIFRSGQTDYQQEADRSISIADGEVLWEIEYEADDRAGAPAYKDGWVYTLTRRFFNPSVLRSYDAQTGAERYRQEIDLRLVSPIVTPHGDQLFISASETVLNIEAATGVVNWQIDLPEGDNTERALAINDQYVIDFSWRNFFVMDRATGDLIFEDASAACVGGGVNGLTLNDTGEAYRHSQHCVEKFDINGRQMVWERVIPYAVTGITMDERTVFVTDSRGLQALDAATGETLWRFESPSDINRAPVSTLNHVFFSAKSGTYALDSVTGELVWSFPFNGRLSITNEGALLINTADGSFAAINIEGDEDADGLPNWFEKFYGFDWRDPADGALDADNDGLSNVEEFVQKTLPRRPDTDGDGVNDGDETNVYLSDPLLTDTDHDGLTDGDEALVYFTNPNSADSDGDTYTDREEAVEFATNAVDAFDKPLLLVNYSESFEQGIPPGWTNNLGTGGGWNFTSSDATDGSFSLNAAETSYPDTAIIEWQHTFDAGDLKFDARLSADNRSNYVRVFVDDIEVAIIQSGEWAEYTILIPRGQHSIRWQFQGSGPTTPSGDTAWIDNVRFSVPRQYAGDAKNYLVSSRNVLQEYTLDGERVRGPITIPGAENLQDLVVTPDHRIAIIDAPLLHIIDPVTNDIFAVEQRGWDTSGNNGIVATKDHILTLDRDGLRGILRFDLNGNFIDRIHIGISYDELDIGPDGSIYASILSGYQILKLDPVTLALIEVIPLELGSTGLTFTVGRDEALYVTDQWCPGCFYPIIKYDNSGNLLDVVFPFDHLERGSSDAIQDIDMHRFDTLIGGTFISGDIIFANSDLDTFDYLPVWTGSGTSNSHSKVAIVTKQGIDDDGDGMPDWWERVHGLDISDSTDALLDADNDGLNNLGEFQADTEVNFTDTDEDGVSDGDEVITHGTNPVDVDTDGDGVTDGDEVDVYGLQPLQADTDGDGISDGDEINIHGTDPLNADTDGDGQNDGWEVENGLDPLASSDANNDADGDGLSNTEELQNGTDVNLADSDFDGLTDGDEISATLTDPLHEDSDGDRIWDGWEVDNNFDPLSALDATADADADGYDNRTEFFAATDPRSSASFPIISAWATHQGNAAHTGFVPVSLDPATFTPYWERDLLADNSTNLQQVASDNGTVWVTTRGYFRNLTIAGLDGLSANTLWQYDFVRSRANSPPALWNGSVYTQVSSPGTLVGFDAATGSMNIEGSFNEQFQKYLAPTPFAGRFFAQSGTYGGIGAFDAIDGMQVWNAYLPQYHGFTPAVDNNYVYVHMAFNGNIPARLEALHRQTGARAFTIDDQNFVGGIPLFNSAPMLTPVNSVVTTQEGRLIRFDLFRKDITWENWSEYDGTPTFSNGILYLVDAGELVAVNERTGQELWRWVGPGFISNDVLVTLDHVFVSTRISTHVIEISSGLEVWSYPAGGALSLGNDRILYISTWDGDLHAVATFADADSDGISDTWEQQNGLSSATADDAQDDADGDGLLNVAEFRLQTNVMLADTDGDGLADGEEILSHRTDPHDSDSDSDGLSDGTEILDSGTNPLEADSDADGLSDADEINLYTTDALAVDTDADGYDDGAEIKLGSDPVDVTSVPAQIVTLVESFESGDVPATWENGTLSTTGWEVVAENGTNGSYQLRSKPVRNHEVAAIEWTANFSDVELAFDAKIPNREFNENITFYVDGELRLTISPTFWFTWRTPLTAGVHTLRWEFHHDTLWVIDDLRAHIDFVRVIGDDSDGDSMADGWELQHGLDPFDPADANDDPDNDGLTNLEEHEADTIPNNPDSDGDTMPDGWEILYGLDPTNSNDATRDPDSDALSNADEYQRGTNPTVADSDADGTTDGWEIQYGFDPLNPSDANTDPDGDSYTNLVEYQEGTDPTDAASHPNPPPPPPPPPPSPVGGGGSMEPWSLLVITLTWLWLARLRSVRLRNRGAVTITMSTSLWSLSP